MKLTTRKKAMILGVLGIVIILAVANNELQAKQGLSASADYVNYEKEQMKDHNGDVLVDSLNISAVSGESVETVSSKVGKTSKSAIASKDKKSQVVTSDDISELKNKDLYFNEARATLAMDRNNIIGMLTEVIAETGEGQEKNNATNQKLKIIDYMNKEKTIESLIKAKGYTDALAVITDSAVTITVNKEDLTQSDVAKICDIVIRETGRNANQIVIQSKISG